MESANEDPMEIKNRLFIEYLIVLGYIFVLRLKNLMLPRKKGGPIRFQGKRVASRSCLPSNETKECNGDNYHNIFFPKYF